MLSLRSGNRKRFIKTFTMLNGISEFCVKFFGPRGTVYEGGVWKVCVYMPDEYPFKYPSIRFMKKIYHPNIHDVLCTVSSDVINETWTVLHDLNDIFESFLPDLLAHPNIEFPVNRDAANMSLYHPRQFETVVAYYIRRFAREEDLYISEENDDTGTISSMSDFSGTEDQDMETQHCMMTQVYSSPNLFAIAFQKFENLRQIEKCCDICLLVSNNRIHAHKLVLSYLSPYFENLFFGPFSESEKNEIELKEVNHEILSILIQYMYTGKIKINLENVYDIYKIADCYQIKFVKEFCAQFLEANLNVDNCIKIWLLADAYISEKLQAAAKNVIALNLSTISSRTEFLNLPEEQVSDILSSRAENELADTFIDAAIRWTQFDDKNRKEFVKTFLRNIPSHCISGEYLDKTLSTNDFLQDCLSCNKTLLKIYREKIIDQKEKFKIYSEIRPIDQKQKFQISCEKRSIEENEKFTTSIFIMTDDPSHQKTSLCYYNIFKNIYLYGKDSPPVYGYEGTIYKKSLYVFGMNSCFSYDGEDNWVRRFDHDNGKNIRAVGLNNSIYTIAGEKDPHSITKYDVSSGQAEKFVLQNNHVGCGATVIDGSIYICGGFHTNIVQRFDPREPISKSIGSIPNPHTQRFFNNHSTLGNNTFIGNVPKPFSFQMKDNSTICTSRTSATSLFDTIYCTNSNKMSKMDIRNTSQWEKNSIVVQNMPGPLCTSHGKIIYGDAANGQIYEIDKLNLSKSKLITVPNILHQMVAFE